MEEEVTIRTYEKRNLRQIEEALYNFLLGLDEERETLFPDPRARAAYPESCRWLVDVTFFVAVAFQGDRIVGVSGLRKTVRARFLSGYWPIIRGFIVVDKSVQGRGIGSRLSDERVRYMKKLFAFHVGEVVRGNVPMERIIEKASYRIVHRDESYIYCFKACRGFMALFSPIFEWVYRYHVKRSARPGQEAT